MSSRRSGSITVSNLPLAKIAALRKNADRLGITPENYIKSIIMDALELDRKGASGSLQEVSKPFQKILSTMSDREIDEISRPHRWKAKR